MPMMRISSRRTWTLILFVLLLGSVVHGATVTLTAYSSYSLKDGQGNNLADGSIIIIVGSPDAVANPMVEWGTNLIAWSTTGDDVLLGWGYVSGGDGKFQIGGLTFDSDQINHMYVRFFDTNTWEVGGWVEWGTSDVFQVEVPGGQYWWFQDFAPNNDLYVNSTNNFYVIPEPGTLSYLLCALGVAGWMKRRHNKGQKRGERMSDG